MFGSKRNLPALFILLAVLGSLALVFSACTAETFHWITPVAPQEAEVTTDEAVETPEPVAEATEEPMEEATSEATEEATEEVAETGEGATEEIAEGVMPAPITHKLERHEFCLDCHGVDGRVPSPANHAKYETEDLCLFCHVPEEGEAAVPALPDPVTPDFCLGCHGPFDELSARTVGFVDDRGNEGNPHVYVPHDRTNVVKCTLCHEEHPLPLQASDEIPQADLNYCYASCHHEYNFEPCSECHD